MNTVKSTEHINLKINENPIFILCVNLSSILGLILGLVSLAFALFNENTTIKIISIVCTSVVMLGIVAVTINRLFTYNKLKSNLAQKLNEMIDSYNERQNDINDIIKNINFAYKNCFDQIKNDDVGKYSNLNGLVKPLCDYIASLSDTIVKSKSKICIKMIETDSMMNEDYSEWKIRTIARSTSTQPNRQTKDNQAVLVSENSDFEAIIGNPKYCGGFIVPNLIELEETWKKIPNMEYKNSTKNFSRYYKSTIVYPIGTEVDLVAKEIKQNKGNGSSSTTATYHIVGFLCWDSKDTFSEDDENFKQLADLLESFSYSLYPILEKYIVYQLQRTSQQVG